MDTPYVTTKELAELLPFSLRHLSERVTHRRDFPTARRIGKRRIWKLEEVLNWIENKKED